MSYLVLARKWRPQGFDQVIGQSHVTRTLENSLKNSRIAHALIFSGPRGVGKTSVARILAKALNCQQGPTPQPCNSCRICLEITRSGCVDVNEIDGASNRGIDEIRQLKEEIRFQPVTARFRIYIIDEVHMLTKEAFNALLKTLEEPPDHAYFIFATTEPRKIPATIHSRCQHYEFKRLTEDELCEHLENISRLEGFELEKSALRIIARQARGSVRDSLSLLDQVVAYGACSYDDVCQALGVAGSAALEELGASVLAGDAGEAISILNTLYGQGIDIQGLSLDFLKFLRDIVVILSVDKGSAARLTRYDEKRIEKLKERFSAFDYHSVLNGLDFLSSSVNEIFKSMDPKISLEIAILQMCAMPSSATLDELIKRLEILGETITDNDEQSLCHTSDNAGDSEDSLDHTIHGPEILDVKTRWDEFKNFVLEKMPQLGPALDSCLCVTRKGDQVFHVKCAPDFRGQMICSKERAKELNLLAKDFFKSDVRLIFELAKGASKDETSDNTRQTGGYNALRQELISSPLVQEALSIFQARISDVTLNANHKRNGRGS